MTLDSSHHFVGKLSQAPSHNDKTTVTSEISKLPSVCVWIEQSQCSLHTILRKVRPLNIYIYIYLKKKSHVPCHCCASSSQCTSSHFSLSLRVPLDMTRFFFDAAATKHIIPMLSLHIAQPVFIASRPLCHEQWTLWVATFSFSYQLSSFVAT